MNLEPELRASLRRVDPPAGFADRVMKKINRQPVRRRPFAPWARAAAVVLLISGAGWLSHRAVEERAIEQRQEAMALHAKDQLMLAMRISSEKAGEARQSVLHNED